MTPFERAAFKTDREADLAGSPEVWLNDTYQVVVRRWIISPGWPVMHHLSIKRIDKDVIRDWRHLQEIKNQIVGPENEAVELFPAESRLVDSANQFHLFAIAQPGIRFPFGFQSRLVSDSVATNINAKQRPFDKPPADNLSTEQLDARLKEFMQEDR